MTRKLLLSALLLLAACTTSPPPVKFADVTFSDRPRFLLEVAELQVVQEYVPPFRLPNVEHQVPLPPAKAAERWGRDRLVPVGSAGTVVLRVQDARIIETSLRTTPGMRGMFTREQAAKYDATVEVSVEIKPGGLNTAAAVATARAERSTTVAEDISPNQLDRVLYELVEGLMRDLDVQLDANIRRYLVQYVRDVR
jgi:hypothetical protein